MPPRFRLLPVRPAATAQASPAAAAFEQLEQRRYLSVSAATFDLPGFLPTPADGTVDAAPRSPQSPDAPAVDKPLKVYSWSDWGIEGVTPLVWAEMGWTTPQDAAYSAIPALRSRAVGDKAVYLSHVGQHFLDKGLDDIVRNGFDTGPDKQWLTTYFNTLKQYGVTPDFIAMDYEDGVSTWSLPPGEPGRVLSDPSLRQYLPADVQQFTAADFSGPRWREVNTAWNTWATEQMVRALQVTVRDTAREVWGKDIDMSNWGDIKASQTIYDQNGWPLDEDNTFSVDGWSSPSLYIDDAGQLFDSFEDQSWAKFVSNLNTLRSITADGGHAAPWITDAGFAGNTELWLAQLQQIRASGVERLLLWNPGQHAGMSDAEYAESVRVTRQAFSGVNTIPAAPQGAVDRLPQLPLDVTRIDSFGFGIDRDTRALHAPVAVPVIGGDSGDDLSDDSAVPEVQATPAAVPVVKVAATPAPDAAAPAPDRNPRGARRVTFFRLPFAEKAASVATADQPAARRADLALGLDDNGLTFRFLPHATTSLDDLFSHDD